MPETQVIVCTSGEQEPRIKVSAVRQKEKFTVVDRGISWDIDSSGQLIHHGVLNYICFGIDLGWRIFLGIAAVYMIIIGAVFFHQCSIESRIPIFMIVQGIFLLPVVLFALLMTRPDRALNGIWKLLGAIVTFPIMFFLIAWAIVGGVWTYGNIPNINVHEESSEFYCQPVLFISSAVLVAVTIVTLIVILYLSVVYFKRGVRRETRLY